MRHRQISPAVFGLMVLPLLVGCPKKRDDATGPAGSASAPAAPSALAAKAKEPSGSRTIAGVGEVPAWSADKTKPATKCAATAVAKARMKTLGKGDDAPILAGTADLAKLQQELLPDDCAAARSELATALNNGGNHHYQKKAYLEANRFWRAAVVVRPSMILARYNLACSLALSGKQDDALWALGELGRAAQDGDAKASNIIEKAKSDDDLKALRDLAAFKEAVRTSQGALVGPRKEPETAAEGAKLLPDSFRKGDDPWGISPDGVWHAKPALRDFWTWRPDPTTELLVATVINADAGPNSAARDYGGIAIFKRDGGKLKLVASTRTGEATALAGGKNNTVAYAFDLNCGSLRGVISYTAAGAAAFKGSSCAGPFGQ